MNLLSDKFHLILLVLAAVSLVVLIINFKREPPLPLPKKEDGARKIFLALISIAGDVLTKGTPTLVLFTGFAVAQPDSPDSSGQDETTKECIDVTIERLSPVVASAVADRIPHVIPDLSDTITRIEKIASQGDKLGEILKELKDRGSSPYEYHATLRPLLSEPEIDLPSSNE